jgi:hypothetical protein
MWYVLHAPDFTFILKEVRMVAWAAVNNAVNEHDLPDLVIVAIVFGFFFLGFILGLFEFARQGGLLVLAIIGGLAFGIRIVLFRDNLLVPIYWVNWLIVGVFGLLLPLGFIKFNRLIIVRTNVVECSGYHIQIAVLLIRYLLVPPWAHFSSLSVSIS